MRRFWKRKSDEQPLEAAAKQAVISAPKAEPILETPTKSVSVQPTLSKEIGHKAGAPSGKEWIVSQASDGDFDTITAAVDAAEEHDTIRIKVGVYRENLSIGKPLHLIGEGDARIAPKEGEPADLVTIVSAGEHAAIWSAPTGKFQNVVVMHDSAQEPRSRTCLAITQGNLEIEHCAFATGATLGLEAKDANITVKDSLFVGFPSSVTLLEHCTARFESNDIGPDDDGIAMNIVTDDPVVLTGNTLRGMVLAHKGLLSADENLFNGLILSGGCNAKFLRNTMLGMTQISDSSPMFVDNIIGSAEFGCVSIDEGSAPVFIGNRITGRQVLEDMGAMIVSDGATATLKNNVFAGCQGTALISLGKSTIDARGNKFHNNSGVAIEVKNSGGTFDDNDVFDNEARAAVYVNGDSNPVFTNNRIYSNKGVGVYVSHSMHSEFKGNSIHENGWGGFLISDDANVMLRDNKVTKNQPAGIAFTHGGRGNLVNNDFRGNAEQSIGIDVESQQHFRGGRFLKLVESNKID